MDKPDSKPPSASPGKPDRPGASGSAGGKEEPVVLIIADISGYTRFMIEQKKSMAHSHAHVIINDLIKSIINEVEIPLEIAKLEGDAIFFYARKSDNLQQWEQAKRKIGAKLLKFFDVFYQKVVDLSKSNKCGCEACTHVADLRLKMVVHSGNALFYKVGNSQELAGVDVVIAHKLLKNSVQSEHYILMTEQASKDISFPSSIDVVPSEERYDDIGKLKTYVYFPSTIDHHFDVYLEMGKKPSMFKSMGTTMDIMVKAMGKGGKQVEITKRKELSNLAFSMIALAVFVVIAMGATAATVLQWRYRLRQESQLLDAIAVRDQLEAEIAGFEKLNETYTAYTDMIDNVHAHTEEQLTSYGTLHDELSSGMKIQEMVLEADSMMVTVYSSSKNRISAYISNLLEKHQMETVSIEPTGERSGSYLLTIRRVQ